MRSFIAFTKKEFIEQIRSYKILILLVIFFVFGMISPLLAKILPDIISSMDMQGMEIIIPKPTYIDGYTQFFSNINQMGIMILLLVFSGIVQHEISKGTLINILSKGLDRYKVILAKFLSVSITWTMAFLISAITNYLYIRYLFKGICNKEIVISLIMLWIFGIFVLSIVIFSSTITNGNYGGLLLSASILGILLIIDMIPKSYKYNPIALASKGMDIIKNTLEISSMYLSMGITVLSTIILIISTIIIFNNKKM